MIGKTGMVDSFNVSLSSFLPDEARTERNVETVYHSCLTNHTSVVVFFNLVKTKESIKASSSKITKEEKRTENKSA